MIPVRFLVLDRYLVREILRPFAATCLLFILLFGSYSSARMLSDAVAGLLPMDVVWQLIALKILIALEVLFPIALYLSVVMGLGRLHADSEMVAMAACGYGEGRVAWTTFRLGLIVAAVVACFAILIRPWAYTQSYRIENRAEAEFDVNKLEAGRFHASQSAGYVLFAEEVDRAEGRLRRVFFSQDQADDKVQVVYADSLTQGEREQGATPLIFQNGYAYEVDPSGSSDMTLRFRHLTLFLDGAPEPLGYRSKAAPTTQLWGADDPKDIAELQWRILRPVSAILLALLAVPLSRTAPRRSRYIKTILAIVLFAVYYNLIGMAKTWVKEGVVGPVPGAWWPDALLLMCVLVWYWPLITGRWRLFRLQTLG
ncbi:MAG: LPS export ABC transporter permease LptF [Methylothermaceae bacterium]|nr:LPS export ABC transporter permease LptF [Methylothermaceae bacterium]